MPTLGFGANSFLSRLILYCIIGRVSNVIFELCYTRFLLDEDSGHLQKPIMLVLLGFGVHESAMWRLRRTKA